MKLMIGGIAVIVLGVGAMFLILNHNSTGHDPNHNPFPEPQEPVVYHDPLPEEGKDKPSQFGADRFKDDLKPVPFDGKRAMKYLESICALGPRVSGTKQMKKQQELIKKHFEDLGAKVTFQSFDAKQNSVKGTIPMTNIIVSFQPEKKRRVIICSH